MNLSPFKLIFGRPKRFKNFREDLSKLQMKTYYYLISAILWKCSWPTGIASRWLQFKHRSISLHSRHLYFMPSMSLRHPSHLLKKPSWCEFLDKHSWASLSLSKSPNAPFCSHVRTENVLISDVNFLCLLKNSSSAFSSLKYQGFLEFPVIEQIW